MDNFKYRKFVKSAAIIGGTVLHAPFIMNSAINEDGD